MAALEVSITNDLEKRIAEAFEVFDHSGDKTVDVREVGTIIRSLGCCPSEAEVQEVIVRVEDQETSGSVHLAQFLPVVAQIISEYKLQPASPEELLKAFQTLDKENKGYLDREFLTKAMMEEGEPFTQEEIDEMMAVAVDPVNGTIPYEFYINQIMINIQPNIYSLIPKVEEVQKRKLGEGLIESDLMK
ncbi:hypothetical protein LSTR_LSTR006087 [Laodelphax striatellus]|uniref:EF-hand domain-containing protein n=1 Tax=Laodelphax striatellus TaxID=195883 RepID=A0A482WYS4_LAOST|nr:hypothetical protein LSTR_LSTR006087 [Laodelphax striatellus]